MKCLYRKFDGLSSDSAKLTLIVYTIAYDPFTKLLSIIVFNIRKPQSATESV